MSSKNSQLKPIEIFSIHMLTFLYGVSYCAIFPIINITNGPILIIIKNVFFSLRLVQMSFDLYVNLRP